jgi:N-acetylglucosaminyldiphosphoundecaprenol N-acetyl-beta-D-mannosaminyltransferase
MNGTAALDRTAHEDPPQTLRCANVPVLACSPPEAARLVVRLATSRPDRGLDIHLCNAYTVALAHQDPALRTALNQAAANLPDGKSVVWANRWLHRTHRPPTERVYGPDLFCNVFALGEQIGLRHYLIGGTPEALTGLQEQLRDRFPRARIVGAESPPFRDLSPDERHAQLARIRASEAQIVWLGLGTPKQDHEAAWLVSQVPVVVVAVGAAFDFVSGRKRQAPAWMQEKGLEWMFRLCSEPRRLWRRYLFGNARFLRCVAAQAFRGPDLR